MLPRVGKLDDGDGVKCTIATQSAKQTPAVQERGAK